MGKSQPTRQRTTRQHRRTPVALAAAGVVVVVALAATVMMSVGQDSQSPSPQAEAPTSGPSAPDFTLRTLGGETFSLADHRGEVVVVEFLAPGCPSCTVDLAGLGKAAEQKPDVTLLVADVSGAEPAVLRDFYRGEQAVGPEVLIAPDSGYKVSKAYGASALGHTVVITPAGTVSWKGRWAGDETQLLTQIDKAAARS